MIFCLRLGLLEKWSFYELRSISVDRNSVSSRMHFNGSNKLVSNLLSTFNLSIFLTLQCLRIAVYYFIIYNLRCLLNSMSSFYVMCPI